MILLAPSTRPDRAFDPWPECRGNCSVGAQRRC